MSKYFCPHIIFYFGTHYMTIIRNIIIAITLNGYQRHHKQSKLSDCLYCILLRQIYHC